MASSRPLLLLLGAGPNVGQAVSKKFQANGYRVALAARSLSDRKVSDHEWSYKIDLGNPSAIERLFSKVSKEVGIPNVVVYNGKWKLSACLI
jgi:NAD(P)-dependent dehydrogenase (short-subunit alcohol dehydrogenase family)